MLTHVPSSKYLLVMATLVLTMGMGLGTTKRGNSASKVSGARGGRTPSGSLRSRHSGHTLIGTDEDGTPGAGPSMPLTVSATSYLPLVFRLPATLESSITWTTVTLPQPLEGEIQSFCTWGGCTLSPRLYHAPLADGRSLVGWTDASRNGHLSIIRDGRIEHTFDFPSRSVRGLVGHEDGTFAVLQWEADAEVMWLAKYDGRGGQVWEVSLNSDIAVADFWLGDGRLAYGNGLYAAYFTVQGVSGDFTGHHGDQLTYVDDAGNVQSGGWDWGCSHSMAELVSYHPELNEFAPICASDCFSSKGILVSNSHVVYKGDGNCGGNVSTQLGQMALAGKSWKLVFNALDRPCCEGRGIALATIDAGYESRYTWLTNTDGAYERDPIIAHLGNDVRVERYLVGWTTIDNGAYWLGVIDGAGKFLVGPEEMASTAIAWGNRDNTFRTRADGSVSWVHGQASSTELNLFRFDGSSYLP